MKIDSYQVNTSASHSKMEMESTSIGLNLNAPGKSGSRGIQLLASQDLLSLSESAQEMLVNWRNENPSLHLGSGETGGTTNVKGIEEPPETVEDMKLKMLEHFWHQLTGRKVSLSMQSLFAGEGQNARPTRPLSGASASSGRREITATHFRYESEKVSYNAKGVVKTADGKEISLDVSMHMSREFAEYSQTSLGWAPGNLCDPLVINYGGTAASLTQRKYDFDLDGDGLLDKISFAGAGSGFLALDKDGNGKINDGSELFGPGTGNGFGELRGHDKDGNGWIDENDGVFDQLRIWSKDEAGNDQLFTLRELGIGAIYLGDISTEFGMKDSANNTQGVMRSTSFFLRENGGAGTLSHIDLLV